MKPIVLNFRTDTPAMKPATYQSKTFSLATRRPCSIYKFKARNKFGIRTGDYIFVWRKRYIFGIFAYYFKVTPYNF